jgi:hypothetical protein
VDGSANAALLARSRCLVALPGPPGQPPRVVPAPSWFDGAAVWLAAPYDDELTTALRRDAACAVVLPVLPGGEGADGRVTVAVGRGRVYSPEDPVGLVLHAPAMLAAGVALALRHSAGLPRWVARAARDPERLGRLGQLDRVVARVALDRVRTLDPPAAPPGIAPALPTVVPAEIRRALSGIRQVVAITHEDASLTVTPAAWSVGYALALPPSVRLTPGVPLTVAAEVPSETPGPVAGLALSGTVGAGPALLPRTVAWWTDGTRGTAQVPAPRGAVTLPD